MELRADYIIVGSGIAALRAAVELAGAGDVLILTKSDPQESNTGYAQGGIAAAIGPDDSPERHAADTIAAGDGLCDPAAVAVLVEEGPRYVRELIDWGAQFDRAADGEPALAIEGAHSARRVLHARDATGREIGRALWQRASGLPRVTVRDHARAVELLLTRDGRCAGVRYLDRSGDLHDARAGVVLLATGGAGQVYRETTNPAVATGDGVAMAYLAGAAVIDLEFVQFHPTVLRVAGRGRFLLSEALRGEGARLLNSHGEPFMDRYEPAGDLAPRDRVSRSIVREAERTGGAIFLSLQHLDPAFVHRRFPLISEACREAGLDLASDRIPIGPAAHYVMGGVQTDLEGRTTVEGLFAAGEVACTGVHGANRLASNSLLEGLVFGARAGRAMRRTAGRLAPAAPDGRAAPATVTLSAPALDVSADEIRDLMWRRVGVFRERPALAGAVATLDAAWSRLERHLGHRTALDAAAWDTATRLVVGRLIARAALRREESRGGHYRSDFPERDDILWKRRVPEARSPRDARVAAPPGEE